MKGKLVIIEGLNGAGKTTTLKNAIDLLKMLSFVYCKGFTSNSLWDSFINKHPHSFTYYTDIAIKTNNQIKPLLINGATVLQDRYVQTVDSYLPDSKRLYNKIFRKLFDPFFLNPDFYIHFTASLDEIISRLLKNSEDTYRLSLVRHTEKIERREHEYRNIYDKITCPKTILDTTNKTKEKCVQELIRFVRRELKC